MMARTSPELLAHQEWLGQIQPAGLVVTAPVLVKQNVFVDRQRGVEKQLRLRELLEDSDGAALTFSTIARELLEWPDGMLAGAFGGPDLPPELTVALPEYDDMLSPTFAIPDPDTPGTWLGLVLAVPPASDMDRPPADHAAWRASPHARLERLLRETGVPVGMLFNGASLRLVYAPRGESSGHLTFQLARLVTTINRPMAGALQALLGVERVTDVLPEDQRLPALLRESRRYQNEVSTALAGQVLNALWELLRGFQRADADSKGDLLGAALRDDPHEVYGGLLTTLMRLVFLLYAEDRGLMPPGSVYQRHYSVSGLFERLREDQARYPDTMDARYGAWAHLVALFRLVHDGGSHGELHFPARHGRLFNPDAYPFLEGRPPGSARQLGEVLEAPRVPDGTVFRVLQNLLMLDGERLSYRALDVEQIGSVYEAMMGFALGIAHAPSIALSPKHIVINLEELLAQQGKERAAWLKENAELKLASDALARAAGIGELVAALGSRISRYTPNAITTGGMYLQPTEERRRSGSHYTPRSLTEPIVRTTLRPILERLGDGATPDQILGLKVCDPAMGSGAFLVEACRLLGERLVRAWEAHKATPKVPEDEDALTYAKRLVAERCLYGVDKNIFAVDLAKLSLWLATLAREHPFTFLDHSLRHGDSLVGLSREQIACLNWSPGKQLPLIRGFLDARVSEAQRLREQILGMGSSDDVPEKARLLRDAEEAIGDVRLVGDVIVSAFFEGDKPRTRESNRVASVGKIETWLSSVWSPGSSDPGDDLRASQMSLRSGDHAIPAFHWELEFPEVFTRANGGFDAFVGNPPFAGKNTISAANRGSYLPWLLQIHENSHGNADLVAHFYRRAFNLLRTDGTFGLIATNTIAQGDTRGTGLRWIRQHGGTIFAARKRMKWPGAAAVVVSVVHIGKGEMPGICDLDGCPVGNITAFLFQSGRDEDPFVLAVNRGWAFRGVEVGVPGLVLDRQDPAVEALSSVDDPRYPGRSVVKAYVGGDEVVAVPGSQSARVVVDTDGLSLHQVLAAPALWTYLQSRLIPFGADPGLPDDTLWQFRRPSQELRAILGTRERVMLIARHSEYAGVTFIDGHAIPNEATVCFKTLSYGSFAILQSRVHEVWARFFGSSLEDRLRYSPSDCFETFPFPFGAPDEAHEDASRSQQVGGMSAGGDRADHCGAVAFDPRSLGQALAPAGQGYSECRAEIMVGNNEGMTKTYNRFHDPDERSPDILRLRELHNAMDRAVLDAYGWTDIRPTCEFILDYEDDEEDTPGKASKKKKPWRYRWPDDIRDDVLARLLALNAQRADLEAPATASPDRTAMQRSRRRSSVKRTSDRRRERTFEGFE